MGKKGPRGRGFFEVFWLCLRSHCPVCGEGRLFVPMMELSSPVDLWEPAKKCLECKFTYRREPGYFFGAVIPVLPILSLVAGLFTAGVYYLLTRPSEFDDVLPSGAAGMALGFIFFYRVTIALYISFDHTMDPPFPDK